MIDNYAPTAKADVTIVDTDGKPVADAKVEFKVYNYAEFLYRSFQTDGCGRQDVPDSRKRDMLVWASKDGKFGYSNCLSERQCLDRETGQDGPASHTLDMDIIPPVEGIICPK